jgi:hypothetical protein
MILAGENRNIQAKWHCLSATLPTAGSTWTSLGMNPAVCDEKLVAHCLSHGMTHNMGM